MTAPRAQVAIIGGGLAGMSAALALREQSVGLDITLYEAKQLAGGRAGSFVDVRSGESVDYCQHVAMGCCLNLLAMMKTAGLENAFRRDNELTFIHPNFSPARFSKTKLLPAPFHLLPSLIGLPYLSWKQRYQISRATFALMRARRDTLLSVSAMNWLVAQKQSPATIRDYWDIVIASALGESCDRVSMSAARKVFIDGFLQSRDASDLLVPTRPLAELFGVAVPSAIIRRDVQFKTSARVRSVTPTTRCSMTIQVSDESIAYDHVILAVPCHSYAKLLSPGTAIAAGLPRGRFADTPCSPISGVHLWFDRPVLDRPHAVLVGTLAQWAFRRDDEPHYVQVVISASYALRQLETSDLVSQVVRELLHAFPHAASAQLIRSRVVTDPQAVFSLRPEVDAVRPASRTALPCLHLAGDFVQTGWPATMEGAVISGRMAASSVLEHLGHRPVVVHAQRPSLASRWLIAAESRSRVG